MTQPKALPPQFNLMARKAIAPKHPRLAEIDRDQPPMLTPNGIGNFKQPGGFMPVIWGAGR